MQFVEHWNGTRFTVVRTPVGKAFLGGLACASVGDCWAAGTVYDVTFSPNGDTLAAGGADQILHFWDVGTAQVAARICALAGAAITPSEWTQNIQGAPYHPPCPR